MPTTTQDILNLANAYASLRQNRSTGSGFEINHSYCSNILEAITLATANYIKEAKCE